VSIEDKVGTWIGPVAAGIREAVESFFAPPSGLIRNQLEDGAAPVVRATSAATVGRGAIEVADRVDKQASVGITSIGPDITEAIQDLFAPATAVLGRHLKDSSGPVNAAYLSRAIKTPFCAENQASNRPISVFAVILKAIKGFLRPVPRCLETQLKNGAIIVKSADFCCSIEIACFVEDYCGVEPSAVLPTEDVQHVFFLGECRPRDKQHEAHNRQHRVPFERASADSHENSSSLRDLWKTGPWE
jgi:hypothetical protein